MLTGLQVSRPADFREFREESILQGIHQRIEEQARAYPGKVAIQTRDVAHTYAGMNGLANSIAAEILSAAGTGLAQAAILLPNTAEMVIGMLASLKAHKAYVPLDPHFPKERLRIMLEDADPSVLVTDDEHMDLARELAGKRTRILNTARMGRYADAPDPRVPCDPLDRAYILYTSGSAGRPKGIAFLHRNLLHSTMCLTNRLFFAPSDRVTWLHSASFAASVVDLYCSLTNGATLYPWDAKAQGFTGLADWLVQRRVTALQWIPSAFRQFLRTVPADFVFPDMRIAVMASEPLTVREVELFRRHFPAGSRLVNQVGTSESYNYRLYAMDHGTPIEGANVPGGYAVSEDREVLILDGERHRLPPGGTGEIGIRSDYMSAGYWRDEALTRSKFVRIDEDERPVYLTGDLGRLEPDGCLIHLGREDSQVKIRGYRVELAEIDHVLTSAPGVADSAVSLAKNRLGEDQLVGYVVLEEPGQFRRREVEEYLESRLPDYMVPRHYVVLDSLPTLPTGKVDRHGLADLGHPHSFDRVEPAVRPPAEAPAWLEREVTGLFRELLQLEEGGADADFLKAGGDSLTTAVLMQRIYQRYGVAVPIDGFLDSPTPVRLAQLIREPRGRAIRSRPPLSSQTPLANGAPRGRGSEAHPSRNREGAADPAAPKNLVIISAGKLGREAFTWAAQAIAAGACLRIKGFLDDRPDALRGYGYDAGILGDVDRYAIEEDDVFIGAIGDPADKPRYYLPIVERGGRFINLVHPLANVGGNVRLGTGILVAPFASITCDVTVGNHVSVGALSNLGHDTAIGDWCQVSSHCGVNGNARLEEGAFLGSHACVIPGVRVGAWAYVGAGSVVVTDVESGIKVFGNPALPIGKTDGPRKSPGGTDTVARSVPDKDRG
jgi:sugar O-acyltransferase (sialic acid O-acetyltransferase NeuD family)